MSWLAPLAWQLALACRRAEQARRGADLRLKRLYDAIEIETGVADLDYPDLKERIAGLKAIRDQAQADAKRAQAALEIRAQRVEVADREVCITGSKSDLLRTLTAISGVKSAASGVRSSVVNWRQLSSPFTDRTRDDARLIGSAGRGDVLWIADKRADMAMST